MKNTKLIIFLFFLSNTSLSQEFGTKLGITISNIRLTDVYPVSIPGVTPSYVQGYSINPSICIFTNIKINQSIDIQTNLSYIIIGSSETFDYSYRNIDDDINAPLRHELYTSDIVLRYLHLSLDLKPNFHIGNIVIYPEIGPSINYLLKASNIETKYGKKYFIFGAEIGGGIDFSLLTGINIFFDAKYYIEFSPFYETPYAHLWDRYLSIDIGTKL
jgi:hypothetical protein